MHEVEITPLKIIAPILLILGQYVKHYVKNFP